MVNLVAAQRPLLHGLMKMAGVKPHSVEIMPGTVMSFWVPSETLAKPKPNKKPNPKPKPPRPVVVLVHGFAAEGIVTWQFQVGALTKKYSVYVPDLLFFGASATRSAVTPYSAWEPANRKRFAPSAAAASMKPRVPRRLSSCTAGSMRPFTPMPAHAKLTAAESSGIPASRMRRGASSEASTT